MKKYFIIVSAILATLFATNSYAQVAGKDIKTKNEISVSYGALSNSDWVEAFGEVVTVMFGGKTKQNSAVGPVSAEYFYRVSPVVAVGAVGVAASFKEDMLGKVPGSTDAEVKTGDYTRSYFTLMPSAKFNWLRKEHFGMYSKIAAGVSFVNTKLHQYVEGAAHEQDKNWMFNWQASLIGIEAGNRLRGFAEFGMGEQGAILIGIRYNF